MEGSLSNSFNWILGEKATSKIVKLNDKWKSLVETDFPLREYRPWLNFSFLDSNELDELYLIKDFVVTSKKDLKKISPILEKDGKLLGSVGIKENHFQIMCDILENNPNIVKQVNSARSLLFKTNPWLVELEKSLISNIIPIEIIKGRGKAGFSSIASRGLTFFSFPCEEEKFNRVDFAIDYAHELGHHSLFSFQSSDNIFEEGHNEYIYSAIKKTKRPAIMAFHALCAISFMKYSAIKMMNSSELDEVERSFCTNRIVELDSMLGVTYQSIVDSGLKLTRVGDLLLEELNNAKFLK